MKKDDRSIIIVLSILVLIALNIRTPRNETRTYGNPLVSTSYKDYRLNDIYQICDDGERIYIFYDGQQGILQVYDMQGSYQCTLLFYKHLNGSFSMAVHENVLYVFDKERNVYIFKNGVFNEFITYRDAGTMYRDLANQKSHEDYQLKAGSVWRVTQQEEYCIIEGPTPIVYYFEKYGGILFIFIFILLKIRIEHQKNNNT